MNKPSRPKVAPMWGESMDRLRRVELVHARILHRISTTPSFCQGRCGGVERKLRSFAHFEASPRPTERRSAVRGPLLPASISRGASGVLAFSLAAGGRPQRVMTSYRTD